MAAEFDRIKAVKEQLEGIASVRGSLMRQMHLAQENMSRAEQELNDMTKIMGFLSILRDEKRAMLDALVAAQEART